MYLCRVLAFAGSLLLLTMTSGYADGDAAVGEELAREWCTRCHNVEPGGPFKQHPPSFASIAVYRSADQIYGRIMFPSFHSNMPKIGYMLTPNNVDDIIAYIISLEKK